MNDIRGAAEEQEAGKITHPDTIVTFAGLDREDLLATAARERWATTVAAPALSRRALAIRVVASMAMVLGVRG